MHVTKCSHEPLEGVSNQILKCYICISMQFLYIVNIESQPKNLENELNQARYFKMNDKKQQKSRQNGQKKSHIIHRVRKH